MLKQFIKKILPISFIWFIVSKKESFRIIKIKITKSNRLFIAIDLALSKNYYREHKSFLEGAYEYENSIKNNTLNVSFLRRNIHRIEKGMLMKPRRDEFALRFILETVNSFSVLDKKELLNVSEYNWAFEVLTEYFKLVKSNHINYKKAYEIFNKVKPYAVQNGQQKKIPFIIGNNKSNLTYEDFLQLNQSRKSVRWFKEKIVPKVIIDKALEIASLTPSSCNRLPYRYIISNQNFELTRKIGAIPAGTVGWSHKIPGIAVLVGKQSTFTDIANRHSIYVDSSLSVMPFVLALESLGVSTCLINWADIPSRENRMNKILSLGKDEKVILSIAFGYAEESEKVAFSQRKYINEISIFLD